MEILELLDYVNKGLECNKSVRAISEELGLDESSIRKRLNHHGYKRVDNKFLNQDEAKIYLAQAKKYEQIVIPGIIEEKEESKRSDIDMDKLKLLLDNLDDLLKLIPNTASKKITFNCDNGLYERVLAASERENVGMDDIINKALEDYLNK